jgi:uncharacterized membrane protein YfhO
MLAETYDPAWNASVDGEPVNLYVANHILRAVPVPAGEHTVVLRYESRRLQIGLAISLAASLAFVALLMANAVSWRRSLRAHPVR